MTCDRFGDTPVWQSAMDLAVDAFGLTRDRTFAGQGDIANQLQRAALSVSSNIAEGFERGTTPELVTFLYYARGSAGEVRSILCLIERLGNFNHLKSQISNLKSQAESCSRQLRAWADHLQNSEIRGQRHLNEQSRTDFDRSKRAEAFLEKLKRIREGAGDRKTLQEELGTGDEG